MSHDPHRIDTHHHILPSFYVESAARRGITTAGDIPLPKWSARSALSLMDRMDVKLDKFGDADTRLANI